MRIIDCAKLGIGTTAPGAMLQVHSAALGTTATNTVDILQLHSPDTSNNTVYKFLNYRHTNGSSHDESELRWQRRVDVSNHGYIGLRNEAITFGYGDNTELMRLNNSGDLTIKRTAAGGVTLGADKDTSNTSDTFLTLEGTSETHGSAVIQKGLAGNTTFYQNVVYHTDCGSAEEVSRITGSGTNGFMMLIRVHTCGHTAAVGDGFDIKYYTWSGGSSTPTQVYTLGGGGSNPDITVSVPSANVLVVNVASADATNTYRGAVQIEYLVPNDFANSTWVVS